MFLTFLTRMSQLQSKNEFLVVRLDTRLSRLPRIYHLSCSRISQCSAEEGNGLHVSYLLGITSPVVNTKQSNQGKKNQKRNKRTRRQKEKERVLYRTIVVNICQTPQLRSLRTIFRQHPHHFVISARQRDLQWSPSCRIPCIYVRAMR